MAEALKEKFSIEPTLTPGAGGVFDVIKDGQLVFSKHQSGRFPDHAEIFEKLNGVR